jgi:hypothetical protein
MLESMRKSWSELRKDKPGHRFQNRYKRAREEGGSGRIIKMVLAVALIAGGVVFLVIPGPGSVLIVVGIAFLAEESGRVARALDSIEARLRDWIRAIRAHGKNRSIGS